MQISAVWSYEKRQVNGGSFVYFGMRLEDPTESHIQKLIAYNFNVLDAMQTRYGPSHLEVKLYR